MVSAGSKMMVIIKVQALVGVVFAIVALTMLFPLRSSIATAERAEGTVTELVPVDSVRPKRTSYKPKVQFTAEGKRITVLAIGDYRVGDTVTVLYQPGHAQEAKVDDWRLRSPPIICGGTSVIILVGTLVRLLVERARRRRKIHTR